MDLEFKLALDPLAERARKQLDHLQTEAATSTALVLPFLSALGYDVFDPREIVPEFTADFGGKKGEKVDFAVMKEGRPIILIEVKCWNVALDRVHESQLYRYFSVTPAKVSILTNGVQYKFFADTETSNKMDERPFFEFDIRAMKKADYEALKRFAKGSFDDENVTSAAQELLFTRGIVSALHSEFGNPSEDFVRHFSKMVYSGPLGKHAKEMFSQIVRRAQQQFLTEFFTKFSETVTTAINAQPAAPTPTTAQSAPALPQDEEDDDIVTTPEEREAFEIVKAILATVVNPARVVMRDTKSYCGILLDDNNRKPLARLRFNHAQKYLGLFDSQKNEEKLPIKSPSEIYQYADRLRDTVGHYP